MKKTNLLMATDIVVALLCTYLAVIEGSLVWFVAAVLYAINAYLVDK